MYTCSQERFQDMEEVEAKGNSTGKEKSKEKESAEGQIRRRRVEHECE